MSANCYRIAARALGVALLLVAGMACRGGERQGNVETPRETPRSRVKVSTRLKWLPGATYAGNYVAKAKGFWSDRGLDVTIRPGGFSLDSIKLVASGADDFGITGADQLLLAREKGLPVVAFAVVLQRTPVGWISRKGSGIKTPRDFIGHRVGAKYGTNTEVLLEALFKRLGLDIKKIERVPVTFDITPFLTGQVDVLPVYVNAEPVWAKNKGVDVNVILPSDYGIWLYGNVYFTTEEKLRTRRRLVEEFCHGILQGWTYAAEHPREAARILVQSNPKLDEQEQYEVLLRTIPFLKTDDGQLKVGWMSREGWEATHEFLVSTGQLEAPLGDLASAYDDFCVRSFYGERSEGRGQ